MKTNSKPATASYLDHLYLESSQESHRQDLWQRWYFTGLYSTIPQSHRNYINKIRQEVYHKIK